MHSQHLHRHFSTAHDIDVGAMAKAKRERTSFNHRQLQIMSAHFEVNQKPGSEEIKMLCEKTDLDRKVVQIWFQNARAKWRKAQDGSKEALTMSSGNMPQICGLPSYDHQ